MNLLRSTLTRRNAATEVFKAAFYSTDVTVAVTSPPRDSIRRRIMRAGDPTISIADVANKWIEEGKQVKTAELQQCVRVLRKYRRGRHALQLLEWMTEQLEHKLTSSDVAIQLDLIGKVRGIEEAKKWFDKIPEKSRDFRIYGALLSCYAHEKSVEQAEATMQKMRELGYAKKLSYNVMLSLYGQTQMFEKMDVLMQEMKERGMEWDNYTYNTRLNAYALASDIDGMEKLLSDMGSDPSIKIDWHTHTVVANGYVMSGLTEKALAETKKAEELAGVKNWKRTFEILLTLYSQIGNRDELFRLWNEYKKKGKFDNTTYLAMVSSLVKLDDIAGAEKIVEEWEYKRSFYDIRIPRFLVKTYCKNGLLEKAEAYMNRLVEIGEEPDASLWNVLASGYEMKKDMVKALEAMKRAISVSKQGWRPNKITIASCLDYLKEKGEVEAAKEILVSLREKGHFPEFLYEMLLDYIVNDGKASGSRVIDQLRDAQRQYGGVSSSKPDAVDD